MQQKQGKSLVAIRNPIEGLMTTYGYIMTDPDNAKHFNLWFTHGTLEVVDGKDEQAWHYIFSTVLENRLEDDGRMTYELEEPVGGWDTFVDLLFMDETLRIVRSSRDLIYVFSRVPIFPDE